MPARRLPALYPKLEQWQKGVQQDEVPFQGMQAKSGCRTPRGSISHKHIPKERLGSTDDCGFSPFSIDVKPKHGSPDVARDIAFQKIRSRVEGTRMASEKLEVASAA